MSRSISARSRALESMMSVIMTSVVGHRLFSLFVSANGESFHFGQITPALLRRHRPADFEEMFQHLGLTLRAENGQFGQFLFSDGTDVRRTRERGIQFSFLGRDLTAHLGAFWHI